MNRRFLGVKTVSGKLLVLILSMALTGGCTTLRPVSLATGDFTNSVQAGDNIQVLTKDGRDLNIEVLHVDAERIEGVKQVVNLDEIEKIERKEISKWKNGLLVLGIGALIGTLFFSAMKEATSAPLVTLPGL